MPAALSRATASASWSMAPTSSDAVGSSSTKTSGPIAHTEAMATIWRWPPESARMSRSRRCSMPSRAKAPSTRRCISARESPRFSQPNATSEVVSRLKNWLRGFWNTEPTRRHSASISHDPASLPAMRTDPASSQS